MNSQPIPKEIELDLAKRNKFHQKRFQEGLKQPQTLIVESSDKQQFPVHAQLLSELSGKVREELAKLSTTQKQLIRLNVSKDILGQVLDLMYKGTPITVSVETAEKYLQALGYLKVANFVDMITKWLQALKYEQEMFHQQANMILAMCIEKEKKQVAAGLRIASLGNKNGCIVFQFGKPCRWENSPEKILGVPDNHALFIILDEDGTAVYRNAYPYDPETFEVQVPDSAMVAGDGHQQCEHGCCGH
jgi:hypothetical protein